MTNKHEKMIKLTSKRNGNCNHNEIGKKKNLSLTLPSVDEDT